MAAGFCARWLGTLALHVFHSRVFIGVADAFASTAASIVSCGRHCDESVAAHALVYDLGGRRISAFVCAKSLSQKPLGTKPDRGLSELHRKSVVGGFDFDLSTLFGHFMAEMGEDEASAIELVAMFA